MALKSYFEEKILTSTMLASLLELRIIVNRGYGLWLQIVIAIILRISNISLSLSSSLLKKCMTYVKMLLLSFKGLVTNDKSVGVFISIENY